MSHEYMRPFGNGHINSTFILDNPKRILQRINTSIFHNPEKLMQNIIAVTDFMRQKNPDCITLKVLDFYKDANGDYYRLYEFIENTRTVESINLQQSIMQHADKRI